MLQRFIGFGICIGVGVLFSILVRFRMGSWYSCWKLLWQHGHVLPLAPGAAQSLVMLSMLNITGFAITYSIGSVVSIGR